jgi:hypothetical protein
MNWLQLRNHDLNGALNGLARQRVPYATTVKILAIVKALETEQKKADAVAKALQDKYFKFNQETKTLELKDEKLKPEAEAAEKEFAETKAKFKIPKIKSVELEGTALSAVELYKLEPFIEMEPEEKAPSHLKPVEGNA